MCIVWRSVANLAKVIAPCLAQFPDLAPGTYTDAATNITFATWSTPNFLFGISLPQDAATRNVTEYIGYLVRSSRESWSLGSSDHATACSDAKARQPTSQAGAASRKPAK